MPDYAQILDFVHDPDLVLICAAAIGPVLLVALALFLPEIKEMILGFKNN